MVALLLEPMTDNQKLPGVGKTLNTAGATSEQFATLPKSLGMLSAGI